MSTQPTVLAAEDASQPQVNPWLFVPTLYFLQGIPVVIVQQMSVTMYKTMGVDNAQIGLWTSLIAWPWTVKMLWGPLVDRYGTKRAWVVVMQGLIFLALLAAAFGVIQGAFLPITLGIFFLVAFLSATHDIAADGFYLLAMPERLQAFFVGVRSAFFRLAMIFATGGLVVVAGKMQEGGMATPQTWLAALGIGAITYGVFALWNAFILPRPKTEDVEKEPFALGRILGSFAQVLFMLVALFLAGRFVVMGAGALNSILPKPLFTPLNELTPLFLQSFEGQGQQIMEEAKRLGQKRQYPFFSDTLVVPLAVQYATSLIAILAGYFSTVRLFRRIGMGPAAAEYFGQRRILAVLSFILFFRFGESMISKLSSPFLLDPVEKGGLGVATADVGLITGTIGILGLTAGGLLGGVAISKFGIKRCIWPMVLCLNIPNLFYVWAAFAKPGLGAVTGLIAVDQFGYGFGFSAYMVYLMFISQGSRFKTSHYAISTGLMAFGAMLAGILSGNLYETIANRVGPAASYGWFFVAVCLCTIPGMLTLFFIPMDKEDIRTAPVEID
jgi:PAT family beta-lactamase induction signal transducer AmpG